MFARWKGYITFRLEVAVKRFSIIIPSFNSQATINRCLDSVFALPITEDEYEVIVIDDCSTDNTVGIIEAYEQVHSNLTLLVQPQNHRQGAARNRGLQIAQGDCIVFLDSDDEIVSGVLSAWNLSQKNDLDMVVMRCEKLNSEGNLDIEYNLPFAPDYVFTGVAFQTEYPCWCTAPWAYMYRRSFLKKVNYPFAEDVFFEDADFVMAHLYHSDRISYSNECGYRMWNNLFSTTHTISYKHVSDYAVLGTRILSLYRKLDDKCSPFADSLLEGGSYNIMRSCQSLFKLKSFSDICSFYTRFDSLADRTALLSYSNPAYCWNRWTRFCMRHKFGTIIIVGTILSLNLVHLIKKR